MMHYRMTCIPACAWCHMTSNRDATTHGPACLSALWDGPLDAILVILEQLFDKKKKHVRGEEGRHATSLFDVLTEVERSGDYIQARAGSTRQLLGP